MTTSNVTQAMERFSTNNLKTTEKKQNSNVDFTSVLEGNMGKTQSSSTSGKASDVKLTKLYSSNNTKSANATSNTSDVTTKDTTESSRVRNQDSDKKESKLNDKKEEKQEFKNVAQNDTQKQISDKLKKLEKSIRKELAKALDVSEEDLEALFDESGIDPLALLNQGYLVDFSLFVSQSNDTMDFLTDESAAAINIAITQAVASIDVVEMTGMDNEELSSLVDAAMEYQQVNASESTSKEVVEIEIPANIVELTGSDKKMAADKAGVNQNKANADEATDVNDNNSNSMTINVKKAENDSDTSEGFTQDSSDNKNEALDNFVDNMVSAVTGNNQINETDFASSIAHVKEIREVVNQVVEQIKVTVKEDTQRIEMQLNPQNLGRINMTVTSKNGVMTASFIVESETAREAIEGHLQHLKQTLEEQGLKVENVEVTTREFSFEQNGSNGTNENNPGQSSRSNPSVASISDDEIATETALDTDSTRNSQPMNMTSTVDFSA